MIRMPAVTRITKHAEKRRVDRLYRRIARLEALLAKSKAELVARKHQYDGAGSLWWVMFAAHAGCQFDVVTWALDADEAIETSCQRWPNIHHGDPIAFRIRKPWAGKVNEPLDDDEVIAVARLVEETYAAAHDSVTAIPGGWGNAPV